MFENITAGKNNKNIVQRLFGLDVLSAVVDNHSVPIVGPFRLIGEHHLGFFSAVGDEFAVFLLLDVSIVVFHQEIFE